MLPCSRNASKRVNSEGGSDYDPKRSFYTSKRQRTDAGDSRSNITHIQEFGVRLRPNGSDSRMVTSDRKTPKNTHLKGRKRFTADLNDATEYSQQGFDYQSLQVERLRRGDDEGSIEFSIHKDGKILVSVNLLVSDTSEYPDHHTFFAFSPDSEIPPRVLEAIESISSEPPRPIVDTIENLLRALSKAPNAPVQAQPTDEDEGEDGEDYDAYDLDYVDPGSSSTATLEITRLQRDFIEAVAGGYRPGLIRFGLDEFSLSVSLPVIALASDISPQALMAWDRRLLSSTQHLTLVICGLRGVYPPLQSDGTFVYDAMRKGASLKFMVGLTPRYKPGKSNVADASRSFGLVTADEQMVKNPPPEVIKDDEDEIFEDEESDEFLTPAPAPAAVPAEPEDEGRFDRFSLSSSLESLLDHALVRLIQLRKKFGLGWAGAELLLADAEKLQMIPEDVFAKKSREILAADKSEVKLAQSYKLPFDPLVDQNSAADVNLPLTAFCYLVRRLTLCPRYCLVCHNPTNTEYEALKPYVCDSKLCAYQYYALNRGPSLEYEIRSNPATVDLLVSLAYSAASDQVMEELPAGLGLRVPVPDVRLATTPPPVVNAVPGVRAANKASVPERRPLPPPGPDGLCEFDELDIWQQRASITEMINILPSILDMKRHLERKVNAGKVKPKLRDMDLSVLPAAWSILRWCVASCTAHLEELTSDEDKVRNIDSSMRQFRFTVGAPDAEAKFKAATCQAQLVDNNAQEYPSLYAFHGSPLRNWHSIIRHGLWFKQIQHGRAYGNGVYFAKDGLISMGSYAQGSARVWKNSYIMPAACTALAEIVNLPNQFVSTNPYFVVQHTEWIVCRYLLVRISSTDPPEEQPIQSKPNTPIVRLDPAHPLTLGHLTGQRKIEIPEPSYRLGTLIAARQQEHMEEDFDADDTDIFETQPPSELQSQMQAQHEVIDADSLEDPSPVDDDGSIQHQDDWVHNPEWVKASIEHLLPPPIDSTPTATMALQRELRAMLKEQTKAASLKELGWYMPPEFISDNLFQWIVELHSFDNELPIAKDMATRDLNSVIFEIRFPPTFPLSPPFFRIIKPRFLPFIQGGGGHVTGGGSMCMDLLTADGWLPSYSISAILLQIKLAISNLDPRPARLAGNWDVAYGVQEALEGYKRAAMTHGWRIPDGIEKLAR